MEEFRQTLEGYRPELQYSQLQPRNIDPDTLVRKSEGELMRTFQPSRHRGVVGMRSMPSLLGSSSAS